jgi:hypothetical protein
MISGKVRGECIHFDCATDEEMTLTWMAFFTEEAAKDLDCDRCGRPLNEVPDP